MRCVGGGVESQEQSAGTVIVFGVRGRLTMASFGRLRDRVRTLVDEGGRPEDGHA